jgi:hypothetical protein
MFKLTLFLVIFLLNSTISNAQSVGVKGGASIANADNNWSEKNRSIFQFYAGATFRLPIAGKFSFCPELLYSGKGYESPDAGIIKGGKTKLSYLSIPLLINYRPYDNIDLIIGTELGFLLAVKSEVQKDPDYKKAFHKFDFSLDAGVAIHLSDHVTMEIRYAHGLTKLARITYYDALGNLIGQERIGGTRVFQAGIVYFFYKKIKNGTPKF